MVNIKHSRMIFIHSIVLLLFFNLILGNDSKKTFVISLTDIDSSKALLQQIYEKAQYLGFDFNALANKNENQLAEKPPAAPGKETAATKPSDTDAKKKDAGKFPKVTQPTPEKKSQSAKPKKTTAKKSSSPASPASKSADQAKKSVDAASKSAKKSVDAASAKVKKSVDAASKSAKLKTAASSKVDKSKSLPSKSSSISKVSASISMPKSISKSASSASLSSSSMAPSISSAISSSISAFSSMTPSISSAISSSISAFSSMAPSSSISPETLEYIDKINSLDKTTISSVMSSCKDCANVDNLLVYKDGNIWRDYTGKIEMTMENGKLVDKTGVFSGKDCGCKKDDIPSIGKIGETGMFQDKQVNSVQCQKQNKLVASLANASSIDMAASSFSSMAAPGISTSESGSPASISPSIDSSSIMGGAATSSMGASDSSMGAATSSMGASDSSMGAATSSMGASDSSMGGGSSSMGASDSSMGAATSSMGASDSSMGGGSSSMSAGGMPGAATSDSSMGTAPQQIAPQPYSVPPSVPSPQPPVVFKAIKLKYDLACDTNTKSEESCISKAKPKDVEYRTHTVTIIDEKRLPPVTVVKTVSRFIVPETVSKTFTQVLKPETVTITKKPDTVVKYAPPTTITKIERPAPVTITAERADQSEIDQVSEDMIDEPIQNEPIKKTIKPSKAKCNEKGKKKDDDVVTINKTVTIPYKGVECVPDCACEKEGKCDNPCMEIKCEIIE